MEDRIMKKDYTIAVAGTGYVGLSIATLLSQHHKVMAVDIVKEKVDLINNRKSPIQDDYIEKYLAEKDLNLTATLDAKEAYSNADFVVIAAPTNYDSATQHFDTSAVEAVIKLVMEYNPEAIMVIKSTIPVGYTQSIREKTGSKNIIWNYYTKDNGIKGYNLKFNREKVEDDTIRPEISDKSGKIEKLRLHSGSIIYDKDKQIEILKNIINKFQNYLEINNFERYEEFAAPWIIDRIFLQGVFFKKPCFKVEEEYRIAINQRIGENGASIKAKRKFMERNGIFIPYIDLPFNKDAVEGITISPTLDYENTRNGVLSMTAKKYRNVNKDNIVKSDIPVRY